jgi:hypothetical protein
VVRPRLSETAAAERGFMAPIWLKASRGITRELGRDKAPPELYCLSTERRGIASTKCASGAFLAVLAGRRGPNSTATIAVNRKRLLLISRDFKPN